MKPGPCIIAVALILNASSVSAGPTCTKKVFDRFCLGGDIALATPGQLPSTEIRDGDVTRLEYDGTDGRTVVLVYGSRVTDVSQVYAPSVHTYCWLKTKLTESYGGGEDASGGARPLALPGAVTERHVWDQDDWYVQLSRDSFHRVELHYRHKTAAEVAVPLALQVGAKRFSVPTD
jgi:hypothetical protein